MTRFLWIAVGSMSALILVVAAFKKERGGPSEVVVAADHRPTVGFEQTNAGPAGGAATTSATTTERVADARVASDVPAEDPDVRGDVERDGQAPGSETSRVGSHLPRAGPARVRAETRATEPTPALAGEIDRYQVALCRLRSEHACVIRLLEGRALDESQLRSLIEAYRARGQDRQARRHMRTYVQRYPEGDTAAQYQQLLVRGR